jgi:dienelactone hydrolase
MQPLELKPVNLDQEVRESIGIFTNIANSTFKPTGPGPFPAVVLMHSCGGVRDAHIKQHAQELLKAGYVVLVVDSFGQRGMENCGSKILSGSAAISDAYAALDFLAEKPFVDNTRIYQVGYSWGAIASIWLSSPQSAEFAGSKRRFTATVANYSGCSYQGKYQFLLNDTNRPLLMLMGDRDNELPVATCFPLLDELKLAGKPVTWHIYPGATHAWDKPSQPGRGYIYSEQVTTDATTRMLAYLNQMR